MIYAGVAGDPVLHSRSPGLHHSANPDLCYLRLAAWDSRHAVDFARNLGLAGLNLTAPFKDAPVPIIDAAARHVGAINTVVWYDDATHGYNTDVVGVTRALGEANRPITGVTALVLGAGGAARAAAEALRELGCAITVAARQPSKAQAWASQLGIRTVTMLEVAGHLPHATIVINCTGTDHVDLPAQAWTSSHILLDASYATTSTLRDAARAAGATVVDGTRWLLHQAVDAHELITGHRPNPEHMTAGLEPPHYGPGVALIGGMGSGKDSVGRCLARILRHPLMITDRLVMRHTRRTIPQIFADLGEETFRRLEADAVQRACQHRGAIIATGGGTVCNPCSARLLRKAAVVVWLWCDPIVAARRLAHSTHRPLLEGKNRLDVLRDLAVRRYQDYAQACHLVIDASAHTPQQIAERIAREINHARAATR